MRNPVCDVIKYWGYYCKVNISADISRSRTIAGKAASYEMVSKRSDGCFFDLSNVEPPSPHSVPNGAMQAYSGANTVMHFRGLEDMVDSWHF